MTGVSPLVFGYFTTGAADYSAVEPTSANVSVSRAGNATLFDSSGKLTYAPNNLLTYSNTFSNAAWLKTGGGTGATAVVTDNYAAAPDGTTTAARVQFSLGATPSTAYSRLYQGFGNVQNSVRSVWLKSNTGASQTLYINSGTSFGTITVTTAWQQFSGSFASSQIQFGLSGASSAVGVATDTTADVLVWNATLSSVTYETSARSGDQVVTTAAAYYGPRFDYNPATFALKGLLLEGSRTNSVIQSSSLTTVGSWTQTAVTVSASGTAPDGTSAFLVTPSVSNGIHRISTNGYVVTGTAIAYSFYAKGNGYTQVGIRENSTTGSSVAFTLTGAGSSTTPYNAGIATISGVTIQSVGNGWYRCSCVCTFSTSGSHSMALNVLNGSYTSGDLNGYLWTPDGTSGVYMFGPQLEAGAFATSYIPTTTATVTRAAETMTLPSYASQLVVTTRTDEQSGLLYYDNITPGATFTPNNGWISSFRVYTGAAAATQATPAWMDVSGTTGNRMLYDSTGKLTYAPNNLALNSEDLTAWTGGGATASNASTLVSAVTNAAHFAYSSIGSLRTGTTYLAAIDVKYVDYRYIGLRADQPEAYAVADLQTGTITGTGNGATNAILTDMGSGWYRISFTYVATGAAAANSVVYFAANGTATYITAFNPGSAVSVNVRKLQQTVITYQTALPISEYVKTTTSAYYGPRFDYDPSTLAAKGLLIEESRANITTYSNAFSNAAWSLNNVTATDNNATGVDGTTSASKISVTTGGPQYSQVSKTNTATASATYTISWYAKVGTNIRYLTVGWASGTGGAAATFDLQNGTVTQSSTVGTGGTLTGASIQSVGNGFYRLILSASSTQTSVYSIISVSDSGTPTYDAYGRQSSTKTVGDNFYLTSAQLELGSFATSYIPTTSASVARVSDIIRWTSVAFSSYWNANYGSSVIQAITFGQGGSTPIPTLVNISDTTTSNYIRINSSTTYGSRLFVVNSAATQVNSTTGAAPIDGQKFRIAAAWKSNDFGLSYNGGAAANTASGLVPAVTQFVLGNWFTSASTFLNGHIQTFGYYNQRLPNATLATKSTVDSSL